MNLDRGIPNMTQLRDMQPPRLRRPVPDDWTPLASPAPALGWIHPDGVKVLLSTDRIADGSWWLHVSLSRADRLPSWDEIRLVKDLFVGRNRAAVQVLPPDRDYVNLHRYCLHLWSPEAP